MSETPVAVQPMQPTLTRQPFSNAAWLFEPKWDGYRAICYFDHGVKLISRNRKELTRKFPELQSIQIKAESAIIDGEIVAIDEDGVPCFDELRKTK